MGVRTVAVYSDADRDARHVALADEARRIGPAEARASYLNVEAILAAARDTGAEAIHPGYGFLSENEDFAAACAKAGIVFIGPSPEAIAAMGDKSAAKRLMEKAGVPLVPGYHGENQDPAFLQKEADKIGYPVLIKASAGGGGKGMRIVDGRAGLRRGARIGQARGEIRVRRRPRADREVPRAAAPHRSAGVRRHARQRRLPLRARLLGAAPPPEGARGGARARPDRRRGARQMGEAAVAAAKSIGTPAPARSSSSPAQDGTFYFMEMNTRLQVEHPVTEMITGLDLVKWQLARRRRRAAAAASRMRLDMQRPRHRGAHLRRESGQGLPALDRDAAAPARAARQRIRPAASPCASTRACARATRSRRTTTR